MQGNISVNSVQSPCLRLSTYPFPISTLSKIIISILGGPCAELFIISHCNLLSHVNWHIGFMSFIAIPNMQPNMVYFSISLHPCDPSFCYQVLLATTKILQDFCSSCIVQRLRHQRCHLVILGAFLDLLFQDERVPTDLLIQCKRQTENVGLMSPGVLLTVEFAQNFDMRKWCKSAPVLMCEILLFQ